MVRAASARQRELGQNFLIDRNILDVIERLAGLSGDDIVLEVGGGPGVLSERLAATAGYVHVIEFDERLRQPLEAAVDRFDNVALHFADAVSFDYATLAPAPTKIVANLPYGVAATVIIKTIDELPSVTEWVVMVQREVGERFAAAAGTGAYGVPSVLAQLACEVQVLRPISRQVFRPVPNVDSVLLGLRRVRPVVDARVGALVHAAFAHRRKALAGSLALAPSDGFGPDIRERARAALLQLGHPADERAERLTPGEFSELATLLA